MSIAVGADHAGLNLAAAVITHLEKSGQQVLNLSTDVHGSVDYPHYASRVLSALSAGDARWGVLVCGTGVGMCMAANRVLHARAVLGVNEFVVRMARSHNDANILCLGERVLGTAWALSLVDIFLNTPFEGGRHARRVEQISSLDFTKL